MTAPTSKSTDGPITGAAPSAGALKRRALAGVVWLSLGNGLRAVLRIGVLAVLARLLDPHAFGLLSAMAVLLWLSMIVSSLGVGPALVQRSEIDDRHVATATTSTIVLGIVLGAVVFFFAPQIAAAFKMPDLVPVLRGMSPIFAVSGLTVVTECLLQRDLRFRVIAGVDVISYAAGYGLLGIPMAAFGFGVWALVSAELAKTTVKTVLLLRAAAVRQPLRFYPRAFAELVGFGLRYSVAAVSTYFAAQGDKFVVGRFLGASSLGVYGRAYELMLVPAQALGALLDKVLFPTLSRVQGTTALQLAYVRCMTLVALLVVPGAAASYVLAPEIIYVLLGPGWTDAVVPLQILAFGMYFRVAYMIGHSAANAAGAAGHVAWRNAVHAMLVIAGAWLAHPWGLPAVSAAIVAAIVAHFAMVLHLSLKVTATSWSAFIRMHAHPVLLGAALGVEVWATAQITRYSLAPPLVTLLLSVVVVLLTGLAILRFAPRLLGSDSGWIMSTLYDNTPAALRRWLHRSAAV